MRRTKTQDEDGGRGRAVAELTEAALGPKGEAPIELRRAALAYGEATAAGGPGDEQPPPELEHAAELVDKVARHAYKVTDEDVAELKQNGTSEGELFDLVVCTAMGAGLGRRRVGLEAVDAWERAR